MAGWYAGIATDPVQAVRILEDDHVPVAPLLALLDGVVLDVGGGMGIARQYLSEDVEHVVLDPRLEWRQDDWTSLSGYFPHMTRGSLFVRGIAEALPFGDGDVDAVIALCSLNHVQDAERAVSECSRVLRPGGTMIALLEDLDRSGQVAEVQPDHRPIEAESLAGWASGGLDLVHRGPLGSYHLVVLSRSDGARRTGDSGSDGGRRQLSLRRAVNVVAIDLPHRDPSTLRGNVDRPRVEEELPGDALEIIGWALGPRGPMAKIEAVVGGRVARSAPTGIDRPDLEAAFPQIPGARHGGFRLLLPAGEAAAARVLELRAVSPAGGRRTLATLSLSSRWYDVEAPDGLGMVWRVESRIASPREAISG